MKKENDPLLKGGKWDSENGIREPLPGRGDATGLDASALPHEGQGVPYPRELWYKLGPLEVHPLPGAKVMKVPFEFPWGVYTMGNTPAHDAGSDLLLCLDIERSLLCGYLQLMRDGMEPLEPAEIAIARALRNC